jgi:hypothetical protein
MRGIFLLITAVSFVFASFARAEEDVYVDVSVLNALSEFPVADSRPRFPVMPKKVKTKKPAPVRKKPAPAVIPAPAPVPVVKEEVKAEEPIIIPARVEKIEELDIKEDKETAPGEESVELSVINESANEEVKAGPEEVEQIAAADAAEETAAQPAPEPEVEIPAVAEPVVEPMAPAAGKGSIYFTGSNVELTGSAKTLLDSMVQSFTDPVNNKIAIYSYNYDDGEDSFRKKRQSLNRAVEIRSYLLGKGYKNFSIKVINVADRSRQGIVEIEELK